jgi:hypothetical protein
MGYEGLGFSALKRQPVHKQAKLYAILRICSCAHTRLPALLCLVVSLRRSDLLEHVCLHLSAFCVLRTSAWLGAVLHFCLCFHGDMVGLSGVSLPCLNHVLITFACPCRNRGFS